MSNVTLPTKLSALDIANIECDLQKWSGTYNMPDAIEQKFLELIEHRMDKPEYIVLLSKYKTGRLNPDYRHPENSISWTRSGTMFLANLLKSLLGLIEALENTKSDDMTEDSNVLVL